MRCIFTSSSGSSGNTGDSNTNISNSSGSNSSGGNESAAAPIIAADAATFNANNAGFLALTHAIDHGCSDSLCSATDACDTRTLELAKLCCKVRISGLSGICCDCLLRI